jgi:anthranilate 1,2-dioxygenase ferredoxin subunit
MVEQRIWEGAGSGCHPIAGEEIMAEFVAVGPADEIAEGAVREYSVGGEEIAVARCDGDLYAFAALCTHAHAYLAEGYVDTDLCLIECPLHGGQFDLATGGVRALPPTEPIKTYPCRVVDGQLEVAVE